VALPVGCTVEVHQSGTGALTLVAGAGVTINAPNGLFFNTKNLVGVLVQVATDTWNLSYRGLPAQNPQPVYDNGNVSGSVTLDFRNGDQQLITVTGNITSLTVSNWPAAGLAKMTLFAVQGGTYTISGWGVDKWGGSAGAPVFTAVSGKEDWFMIATRNGGTTKYGAVMQQNFG
jgi:hypothetical protein